MASNTLSPQMRDALRAAIVRPGRLADAYNLKTVQALMHRDLVRLMVVDVGGIKRDAVYPTLAAYELSSTNGGWDAARV